MSKTYTVPEVFSEIAKSIKVQIAEYEAGLTALRQKELQRSHGKLAKSELCPLCATPDDVNGRCACLQKSEKLDKASMASSSASAITPPKARTATPVAVANHEMGGFKSIASKPPISSMGRIKAAASGSIMAKDEMGDMGDSQSMAMSEECPKCGKSGALCKCMGKMELSQTPKKGGNETGSGGETKKVPLKKSAIPSGRKAPEVQGVAGKQPMGQDGGGVNKVARGLADVPGGAGNVHPTVPVQTVQPGIKVRGGAAWLKTTHAAAHRVHPAQAAPPSQRFHGALPLQRAEMSGEYADKTGLDTTGKKKSSFFGKEPPLHISTPHHPSVEKAKEKKKLLTKMEDLGKCAMCKSEEHSGKCMKALEA